LRARAIDGHALTVDQELGVVPFDFVGEPSSLDSLQVFVERMSVITVDVDLGEHVEGEAVLLLHSRLDLRVGARLLASKLVAREGGDTEPISFVFFVQSLKLMVVGVGQTSVGRHIHHHHHFAFVFFSQLHELFIDILSFELINGRRQSWIRLLRPDNRQVEQEGCHQAPHFVGSKLRISIS